MTSPAPIRVPAIVKVITACFFLCLILAGIVAVKRIWFPSPTPLEIVAKYEDCVIVRGRDNGTLIYWSLCPDASAVTWMDESGKTKHTMTAHEKI